MLQNGEVDTGLFNGFLFNVFGIGSSAMGELNALSKNATIDKLMNFKGPTTDFEFSQSEAAAFASIMKGEDVNEGMKTARAAIERAIKRNATLAESAYGTMTDMGEKIGQSSTVGIVGKNYKPWWEQQASAPAQTAPQGGSGGGAASNAQAMPEAQALEWLRNNNARKSRLLRRDLRKRSNAMNNPFLIQNEGPQNPFLTSGEVKEEAGPTGPTGQWAEDHPDADAPVTVKEERSPWDMFLGGFETLGTMLTGATGGTLGTIGGTLYGVGEAIADGTYGTQEGVQTVADRASEGGEMLTYAPRTEAGQDYVEAVGEAAERCLLGQRGWLAPSPAP